jgi:hypothetical protein
MTGLGLYGNTIRDLYFEYVPAAGHLDGCRFHGTDMWEATRYTHERFNGEVERKIRLACRECGVVYFQELGEAFESTHADVVGYAAKPEKVLGVWLHPGPRLLSYDDERGPAAFYVTLGKEQPRSHEDVLGVVAWHLGRRGGLRWEGAVGVLENGCVKQNSAGAGDGDFATRHAALRWVLAHISPGDLSAGSLPSVYSSPDLSHG